MQSFYHHHHHHHHHPRKLLKVTAGEITPKSCQSPCDPHKNTLGSCPVACIGVCTDVCKYPQPVMTPITESSAPKAAHIGPSQQRHNKSHHLSPYGIVLLSGVIAACLALTIYATYKLCKRRRRPSSLTERVDDEGEEQNPNQGDHEFMIGHEDEDGYWHVLDHPIWYIRTIGLLPSVIGSITVVDYKKGDGLIEGTGCSVCLTEFEEDERVKLLPKCAHAFHITCVDTWLRAHTNCPLCRAPVMNSNASQEITTLRQNLSVVEDTESSCDNSDDEGGVVGIELENDDDGSDESRTNRGFDDRRDGLKIVHEHHEEDCNSATKSVVNFDQCTVESV